MSRLTEKLNDGLKNTYCTKKATTDLANLGEVVIKLGQLEDLEEKLGIELATLLGLRGKKIYVNYTKGFALTFPHEQTVECILLNNFPHIETDYGFVEVKDLNKTWFLTEEEAKKDLEGGK